MKKIAGIYIFIVILMTSQILAETVYYLDATNGNDQNDGISPITPWKTINHVNYNWWRFETGDNLLLKRGEIFTDAVLEIAKGGTESNPLVVGAYGNGPNPIIDCGPKNLYGGIQCWEPNLSHIIIQDLVIKNSSSNAILFDANNASHIKFSRIEVENVDSCGFLLYKINKYTIEDCKITNCGNTGIAIIGSSSYPIKNGIIKNNVIRDVSGNDGITLHKDEELNDVGPTHSLLKNVCSNCGEEGIDITSGNQIVLRGNETFDTRGGIVIDDGPNDVVIDRHYSHHDYFGMIIEKCSHIKITSSIIYKAGYHSLTMGDSSGGGTSCTNFEVYNNTVVHTNNDSIIDFYSGVKDVKFKNNIVTSTLNSGPNIYVRYLDGTTPQNTNSKFGYNIWWRPDGLAGVSFLNGNTLDSWKSAHNQGEGSSIADPRLANPANEYFYLQPYSPCIDAGTDVGLSRDFEGNSIPQGLAPDIGAYEYQGESPSIPIASFSAYPIEGIPPLEVSFDASASYDPDGNITSYEWDFGDENTGTGITVTYTYQNRGTYTAKLTISDNDEQNASDSQEIKVGTPPVALFEAFPSSGNSPLKVEFDASYSNDSDGEIVSYDWDFGDGTQGNGKNVTHTYFSYGKHTATLKITDDDGLFDATSKEISVAEMPYPPLNVKVTRVTNRGYSSSGCFCRVEWSKNPKNTEKHNIVKYRIYRKIRAAGDNTYVLIQEVGYHTFGYDDRSLEDIKELSLYTYAVSAVDDKNRESELGKPTLAQ